MTYQITIRHICNLNEFEELKNHWDTLLDSYTEKTIFLTWGWLYAWWKHNCEGRELWLLTAWQEDKLVGIAPLMLSKIKKHGFSFRLLQTLGTPNTDQSDFISSNSNSEVVRSFCEYILEHKKNWDAIELDEHKANLYSTELIKNFLSTAGLNVKIKSNLHYHIPVSESWDSYQKSLSRNMRRDMDRTIRDIQKDHKVNLARFTGENILREHYETIFEINNNGKFPEKYRSQAERDFHFELLNVINKKNWIEIVILYLDGKPVAFEYGFNIDGRFEDWRTGYDTNYGEQAVGKVLLILLLKDFFNQGYKDFDFLRGEYDHKERWKPSSREFLEIKAVQPTKLNAQLALITLPAIWHWVKKKILNRQGNHT